MKNTSVVILLLSQLLLAPLKMYGATGNENPFLEVKSYYEVCNDLDLKGKTITLPKDATVCFRGGQVSNGKIVCNNNRFEGYNGIAKTVLLTGTVKGPFDVSVYQLKENDRSFDIGAILNTVSGACKSIVVPDGTYYFSTPIVLKDMKYYQQLGDLYYNGKSTNVVAVQFYGGNSSVIDIIGRIYYDTQNKIINYTKKRVTNIVGVEIVNYHNSDVKFQDVAYFNNNIRISGYGSGTSYNKFTIGMSAFSNEHIRIYQKNLPTSQIGWCNENTFYGGRFSNWSHFDWNNCESVAIRIEGAETGDTYNTANSLLFIKPSMEGFKGPAIYAKNVEGCHWLDARTEGCDSFIKFVGVCRYNTATSAYGTERIDYSECATYPLKREDVFPVYTSTHGGSGDISIKVNTEKAKFFKVDFGSSNAKARVGIYYMNTNGNLITKSNIRSAIKPRSVSNPNSYYFNKKTDIWMLASDSSESEFEIPEDVTQVKLVFSGTFDMVTVYSDAAPQINRL